jgi:hypothetical protein
MGTTFLQPAVRCPEEATLRPIRTTALAMSLALVVVACGDSGPTAVPVSGSPATAASPAAEGPSATPSPPATPSPTPVDVAALAEAALAATTFTAEAEISGSGTLGKVKSRTTGSLEIEGRATHVVRTTTTGKTKVKVETITANSTRYAKQKGVWVELGEATNSELIAQLRATTTMTDLGVETKDGRELHHLQATLPAVPAELGVSGDAKEATATLDAWVTEDGTPVVLTVTATWTQEVGGKTVKGSRVMTFTFSNVGGDITVAPPDMIWAFHTSKRFGYRMACPVDWTWEKGTSKIADSCFSADRSVIASRARQTRATLSYLRPRIAGQLRNAGFAKAKVTSDKKTTLDGVPARRIEFTATVSGDKVWGQGVYAIKGAWWYFIVWGQLEKTTSADRAMFKQFQGSFDFR